MYTFPTRLCHRPIRVSTLASRQGSFQFQGFNSVLHSGDRNSPKNHMKKDKTKLTKASPVRRPVSRKNIIGLDKIWRRLDFEVGTFLFMDILWDAVMAMLDDLSGHDGAPGKVTRRDLFDTLGRPTAKAASYIRKAFAKVIRKHPPGHWTGHFDLRVGLLSVLNEEVFDCIQGVAQKWPSGARTPTR